jgi:multiple sugar transport system ATP-binding protein
MRTEIKELHQRLKTTTVYVTHDQIEAMTMADKIVVMHDGIVEQIGTPLELYDNPANQFVAGFIGSPAMNFIKGTLKRSNGTTAVEIPSGQRLPTLGNVGGDDGQAVIYGVRPEHFDIGTNGGGMPVNVHVVEPTGADTFVYGDVGGSKLCAVFSERHEFRNGEVVSLIPRPESTHVFDAASGKRMH